MSDQEPSTRSKSPGQVGHASLVHVFGPHQMIPLAAGLRWYRIMKGRDEHEGKVTTVVYMPGWGPEQLLTVAPFIRNCCLSQGWGKPVLMPEDHMLKILSAGLAAPEALRIYLGKADFSETCIAHDIVGEFGQLAMRAFDQAAHIEVGDSLGFVQDKEYFMARMTGQGWDEPQSASMRPSQIRPNVAALILPGDETGDCLKGKELLIVPKLLALAVIDDFRRVTPELVSYSQDLLGHLPAPRYFMMLANFAEQRVASEQQEVELYCNIVRQHAPAGSSIIFKPHPFATSNVVAHITEILKTNYSVAVLDRRLGLCPAEMWVELIQNCQVIALSYTAISARFLFGRKTIYAWGPEIIERYLNPPFWPMFKESDVAYRSLLDRLESWDERSILWSGRRVSHPARA